MTTRSPLLVLSVCAMTLGPLSACSGDAGESESVDEYTNPLTSSGVAALAKANVGKGACSKNSRGGHAFDSSCTGNGGEPEYWCADFARWVWGALGAEHTGELTAAAGSFYVYGEKHGTLHKHAAVGDAVVFDYHGGGSADHVALVTKVDDNGTIETVSGDWGGESGSEAHFASTSHVVLNAPAYAASIGDKPGIMGMTISGFVSPVGLEAPPPPPPAGCGILDEGHELTPGESKWSCDGHHELVMQTDGNLVLYHRGVGPTWATGTDGKGGHTAIMQADGNFVLHTAGNKPLWASNTWKHDGAHLAVQDDGNLVVYLGKTPLWASLTDGK